MMDAKDRYVVGIGEARCLDPLAEWILDHAFGNTL